MRALRLAAALAVALLSCIPVAGAAPCAGFTDVDDASPFCVNVAWMKNRAITLGCTATLYCPNDYVTRLQMAAFMYRLGFQNAFLQGGNAFGATATLGTTDDQWVDVIANGSRVMSFEPLAISPNIVGGHPNNVALGLGGVIAGGGKAGADCPDPPSGTGLRSCRNHVTNAHAAIGGGYNNVASGEAAAVAGGNGNSATAGSTTVGGGMFNTAQGPAAVVGGGALNVASGASSVVPGGTANVASGPESVAMGHHAHADQERCMVFGAWTTTQTFNCIGSANAFRFGADHGWSIDYFGRRLDGGGTRWVYIGDIFAGRTLNTWNGAHLTDASVWVGASSSRVAKTDFADVDADAVLDKVAALPITTWRYREGEGEVRHIGPMAEDFHAAFGVGYGPHTIADLDARGVALAAIQALKRQLAQRDAAIAALTQRLDALEARLPRKAAP